MSARIRLNLITVYRRGQRKEAIDRFRGGYRDPNWIKVVLNDSGNTFEKREIMYKEVLVILN